MMTIAELQNRISQLKSTLGSDGAKATPESPVAESAAREFNRPPSAHALSDLARRFASILERLSENPITAATSETVSESRALRSLAELGKVALGALPSLNGSAGICGAGLFVLCDELERRLAAWSFVTQSIQRRHRWVGETAILHQAMLAGKSTAREAMNALAMELALEVRQLDRPVFESFQASVDRSFTAIRSVDCALLAGFLARNEPLQCDRVPQFVAAALVQNAGLANLVAAPTSAKERAEVEVHATLASKIARQLLGFPIEWAKAVAEHHERLDQSGSPHRPVATALGLEGRLLAVCEHYVELRAGWPDGERFDAKRSLKECLRQGEAGRLDSHWTTRLLQLGFHDPSVIVELSTGEQAEIVANQQVRLDAALAALPFVRIVRSADGRRPAAPIFRNLAMTPEVRIVKSLEQGRNREPLHFT